MHMKSFYIFYFVRRWNEQDVQHLIFWWPRLIVNFSLFWGGNNIVFTQFISIFNGRSIGHYNPIFSNVWVKIFIYQLSKKWHTPDWKQGTVSMWMRGSKGCSEFSKKDMGKLVWYECTHLFQRESKITTWLSILVSHLK